MLRAENLSLTVPGKTLVKNLQLECKAGELWAVLGKNGSGKTTLLHALSGINPTHSKLIQLNQIVISSLSAQARAKKIGILLQQEGSYFSGNVHDYVLLGRFPHGDADVKVALSAMRAVQIESMAQRQLASLSGGEFQRARIAQLLCQQTDVLCLDEPLMHLDVAHQYGVMQCLRDLATKRGKTVIMSMHEPLWCLRYCSHALLLFDGGETESGAAVSMLTAERLQKLYACDREALAGFGML